MKRGVLCVLVLGLALASPAYATGDFTLTVKGKGTVTYQASGTLPWIAPDFLPTSCGPPEGGPTAEVVCSRRYTSGFNPLTSTTHHHTVHVTATPSAGWQFTGGGAGWTTSAGTCTGTASSCSVVMDTDRTLKATFVDRSAPNVSLAPLPAAINGDVTLTATATDVGVGSGITSVTFWAIQNSTYQLLGSDDTASGDTFSLPLHTRQLDNGPVQIEANAVDGSGNSATSPRRDTTIANAIATRFAAPGASGPDPCAQTAPCSLQHAIEHAISGEEVVVQPGEYNVEMPVFVARNVNVHGAAGQPRPRLVVPAGGSAGPPLVVTGGATISHLAIEQNAPGGVGASAFPSGGPAVLSNLLITTTGTGGTAFNGTGNIVVRDSVLRTTGANSQTVFVASGIGLELRNVTAWATGPTSDGLRVHTPCFPPPPPEPPGTCMTIGSSALAAKNLVVRATRYDLVAEGHGGPATITVSHSNFRPSSMSRVGAGTVNDQGGNQSAEPAFVNASAGDFHQLPTSPTIDAGTTDDRTGSNDFDGQARSMGPAPDMGADEFLYADVTVTKRGRGLGQVTSSPAGIDCGADCSETYRGGTAVTLTAAPALGSRFGGWTGACSGSATSCSLTIDAAKDVTATFTRDCVVPRLKGKTLRQAKAALTRAFCRLGRVTRAYSARVKKGRVISQSPAAGRRLPENSKVNVKLSRGPRP